jgi:HAMP domain-containing protein
MKAPKISFKLPKVKIYGIDVIKNFLFFTLFIIITLLFIAFIISPAINNFKKAKQEYYQTKYNLEVTTNEYKDKLTELKKLKNSNRKILNALKRDFDENNFKLFASKYMSVYSIKETNSTVYHKDFIKTTYFMKAKIKSPKNFYDFIDALKNYKSVLRVYFPIDFVKNKENIDLTLKLEHYKLNPKKAE